MLNSLLYVSRSLVESAKADEEVERIVQLARVKNKELGITGALVFTQTSFAQVIEGSKTALDQLMASVLNDARHTDVQVVRTDELQERRFSDWWMAYSGPSFYVDRHIKPLLGDRDDESERSRRADRLIALMREFTVGV
jgi:hypothetical protein